MNTHAARPLVLLVGDDEDRSAHVSALWNDELDVDCASSAVECIRLVRQLIPSVIIMHKDLRDGDGWELVRVLKGLSSTRRVPIVAIAANDSHSLIERAFEVGCESFLPKPFEPRTLVAEVRRLLLVDVKR